MLYEENENYILNFVVNVDNNDNIISILKDFILMKKEKFNNVNLQRILNIKFKELFPDITFRCYNSYRPIINRILIKVFNKYYHWTHEFCRQEFVTTCNYFYYFFIKNNIINSNYIFTDYEKYIETWVVLKGEIRDSQYFNIPIISKGIYENNDLHHNIPDYEKTFMTQNHVKKQIIQAFRHQNIYFCLNFCYKCLSNSHFMIIVIKRKYKKRFKCLKNYDVPRLFSKMEISNENLFLFSTKQTGFLEYVVFSIIKDNNLLDFNHDKDDENKITLFYNLYKIIKYMYNCSKHCKDPTIIRIIITMLVYLLNNNPFEFYKLEYIKRQKYLIYPNVISEIINSNKLKLTRDEKILGLKCTMSNYYEYNDKDVIYLNNLYLNYNNF